MTLGWSREFPTSFWWMASLGSLIAQGKLPVRKVLDIAVQVAGGLAVAH